MRYYIAKPTKQFRDQANTLPAVFSAENESKARDFITNNLDLSYAWSYLELQKMSTLDWDEVLKSYDLDFVSEFDEMTEAVKEYYSEYTTLIYKDEVTKRILYLRKQ